VKIIRVCCHNDVTLTEAELQGKGSTDCENCDSTSQNIISGSGLEIYASNSLNTTQHLKTT